MQEKGETLVGSIFRLGLSLFGIHKESIQEGERLPRQRLTFIILNHFLLLNHIHYI
jgi:hypothetical protein